MEIVLSANRDDTHFLDLIILTWTSEAAYFTMQSQTVISKSPVNIPDRIDEDFSGREIVCNLYVHQMYNQNAT